MWLALKRAVGPLVGSQWGLSLRQAIIYGTHSATRLAVAQHKMIGREHGLEISMVLGHILIGLGQGLVQATCIQALCDHDRPPLVELLYMTPQPSVFESQFEYVRQGGGMDYCVHLRGRNGLCEAGQVACAVTSSGR